MRKFIKVLWEEIYPWFASMLLLIAAGAGLCFVFWLVRWFITGIIEAIKS
jgi:hypothetical protein